MHWTVVISLFPLLLILGLESSKAWHTPPRSIRTTSTTALWAANGRRPPLRKPIRQKTSEAQDQQLELQQRRASEAKSDPTLLSSTDLNTVPISDRLRRRLQNAGLERLTHVQAQSFDAILHGQSAIVRARTGTGKTYAFLLPLAQQFEQAPPRSNPLRVLIVAPTRELAIQIGDHAKVLFDKVVVVYGGTKLHRDTGAMKRQLPTVLVATPGRLVDLIPSKAQLLGSRTLADILHDVDCVVLDEADRLLEGFSKELKTVFSRLKSNRQTLLFSATFPKHLHSKLLPKEHVTIDCIGKDELQTSQRVEQSYIMMKGFEDYLSLLLAILQANEKSKIIVFFPTTKIVKFWGDALKESDITNLSIHSRMSRGARRRVSEKFRKLTSGILLTSDVSARGVDYPDVDLVVQYGAPFNDALYVHRLGRTARAGRHGRGLLVLLPFEGAVVPRLCKWNLTESSDDSEFDVELGKEAAAFIRERVHEGGLTEAARTACKSFMAHYLNYSVKGVTRIDIEASGEEFAKSLGLDTVPPLTEDQRRE